MLLNLVSARSPNERTQAFSDVETEACKARRGGEERVKEEEEEEEEFEEMAISLCSSGKCRVPQQLEHWQLVLGILVTSDSTAG